MGGGRRVGGQGGSDRRSEAFVEIRIFFYFFFGGGGGEGQAGGSDEGFGRGWRLQGLG